VDPPPLEDAPTRGAVVVLSLTDQKSPQRERVEQAFQGFCPVRQISETRGWSRPSGLR